MHPIKRIAKILARLERARYHRYESERPWVWYFGSKLERAAEGHLERIQRTGTIELPLP